MARQFALVLIKPSHYDDNGYVIQWWRSAIPSNSLAALYGLAQDCAERRVLGDDVDIRIHAFDETNTRIRPDRIAGLIEAAGAGMAMLVGVQSNQFPRALDIAVALRARDVAVGIGGFHVSGTIAMLDGDDAGLRRARAIGASLYAGEAEGRLDEVLRDAWNGRLKPLYNYMHDLPAIQSTPPPILPPERVKRTIGAATSFDAGRGCPYQCSFCTIINVQGRKSRRRSPDDVEKIVRANLAQGLNRFFITDDNFARNKDWEAILDRLIYLRRVEGLVFALTIQVDTLCHRLPGFIEKCALAGVKHTYVGLENINPDSLLGAKKPQNKITEYRKMLLAWKRAGVMIYAGYILGFPNDTVESILRDIDVIKKELPIDLLEFFFLTPLPGSEDHQKLHGKGVAMEPDLNNYDLNHFTTAHAKMTREEWERVYRLAWDRYYTDEHLETVLRRAAANPATRARISPFNLMYLIAWFKASLYIEKIHPLEVGFLRRKYRRDRRPSFAIEPVWRFYPHYFAETFFKQLRWLTLFGRLAHVYLKIARDPKRYSYMDDALTPPRDEDVATRELFQTRSAKSYLDHERRVAEARAS